MRGSTRNTLIYRLITSFQGMSEEPGQVMDGEENLYRQGAKRWKKIFQFRDHCFAPRRYGKLTSCPVCGDIIWGIGRQVDISLCTLLDKITTNNIFGRQNYSAPVQNFDNFGRWKRISAKFLFEIVLHSCMYPVI